MLTLCLLCGIVEKQDVDSVFFLCNKVGCFYCLLVGQASGGIRADNYIGTLAEVELCVQR